MLLWLSTALYIFCVVLCACAAFLVLLYGTQMDLVQRAAWSTAVFASLCFDAAVMRPLMCAVEVAIAMCSPPPAPTSTPSSAPLVAAAGSRSTRVRATARCKDPICLSTYIALPMLPPY